MQAWQSSIIYDFFMYGGKGSAGSKDCGVEWSVLGLVQELLKYQNHQLYFDNWFSILQLLLILKEIGIGEVTATFRVSWIASSLLITDKVLRAKGWRSYDFWTDNNSGLRTVEWWNNKGIILGSTFAGVGASGIKKRWDRNWSDTSMCSILILSAFIIRVWVVSI